MLSVLASTERRTPFLARIRLREGLVKHDPSRVPGAPPGRALSLVCLCVLLLSSTVRIAAAQTWARFLGPPGARQIGEPAATRDGGCVLASSFWSGTDHDVAILKLSSLGIVEWEVVVAGSSGDSAQSTTQLADGSFVVYGSTQSFEPATGQDPWLVHLDEAGSFISAQVLESRAGGAFHVDATPDGGAFLASRSLMPHVPGSGIQVTKLDASLNVEWCFDTRDTSAGSTNVTAAGGAAIAVGRNPHPSSDLGSSGLLARVDAEGVLAWTREFWAPYDTLVGETAPTPDGGSLMVGSARHEAPDGDHDAIVVRLDRDGAVLWQLRLGSTGTEERLGSADRLTNGDFVVGGYWHEGHDTGGDGRPWVARITDDGVLAWSHLLELTGVTQPYAQVAAAPDGGFFVRADEGDGPVIVKLDDDGLLEAGCPPIEELAVETRIGSLMIDELSPMTLLDTTPTRVVAPRVAAVETEMGCPCAAASLEELSERAVDPPLLVTDEGNRIVVENEPGATSYNIFAGAVGDWSEPTASCHLTGWLENGDGTITLGAALPPNAWVEVTASNACAESPTSRDNFFGRRRAGEYGWTTCGPQP